MKLTDNEIAKILEDIVILVDTREQKNEHIMKYLHDNEIPYEWEKQETADYTFRLPHYPQLNLDRKFLVEKKNSLDEIAGNFTRDRDRFHREFQRVGADQTMHVVVENATWKKIMNGSYRSKLHPKSMVASMLSFSIRYNCPVWFVGVDESPMLIYNLLRYQLMERLKEMREHGSGQGNTTQEGAQETV